VPILGVAQLIGRGIRGSPGFVNITRVFGPGGPFRAAIAARNAVAQPLPIPPPSQWPTPPKPSEPGYRPDLTERPGRKPPAPPKPPKPPPKPPRGGSPDIKPPSAWRGQAGFIVGVLAAQYGIEFVRKWLASEELQPADKAAYDRAIEQWERAQRERRGRELEERQDEGMRRLEEEQQRKRQAEERARQVLREIERDRILYEPIVITAKRLPVPTIPPPKRYLGLTLAQWTKYGALAAPFLLKKDEPKRTAKVLTSTNVNLAGYPQPSPQSFVSFGGAPAAPSTPPGEKCKCPPKKKRKPRARRTVCYAGSYTERADGLRKTKRRKVPCQ